MQSTSIGVFFYLTKYRGRLLVTDAQNLSLSLLPAYRCIYKFIPVNLYRDGK